MRAWRRTVVTSLIVLFALAVTLYFANAAAFAIWMSAHPIHASPAWRERATTLFVVTLALLAIDAIVLVRAIFLRRSPGPRLRASDS